MQRQASLARQSNHACAVAGKKRKNQMSNYKVSNFSAKTPEAEQSKLKTNLKGMPGVESVKLHPDKGEISISCGSATEPKDDVVKAAVQKAGFTLGARS
jgi:copper chaperone CopZ